MSADLTPGLPPDPSPELVARARNWVADDPDARTREELSTLIDHAESGDLDAVAELADRFATHLSFGTAGLRGEMAAWLSQGKAKEHVVAFVTATGDDGGEGAVYVALRR